MELIQIKDYLYQIRHAETLGELYTTYSQVCDRLGCSNFQFILRQPYAKSGAKLYLLNGYPHNWCDHYFEMNYWLVDPTVKACIQSLIPLHWRTLSENSESNDKELQVMFDASDFGLKDGVSIATQSPRGEFSISSGSYDQRNTSVTKHIEETSIYLQLVATELHSAILNWLSTTKPELFPANAQENTKLGIEEWSIGSRGHWGNTCMLNSPEPSSISI